MQEGQGHNHNHLHRACRVTSEAYASLSIQGTTVADLDIANAMRCTAKHELHLCVRRRGEFCVLERVVRKSRTN